MASVASQLIGEVTSHAQSDSLEDVREIHADGTYFPKNLCTIKLKSRNLVVGYIEQRMEKFTVGAALRSL